MRGSTVNELQISRFLKENNRQGGVVCVDGFTDREFDFLLHVLGNHKAVEELHINRTDWRGRRSPQQISQLLETIRKLPLRTVIFSGCAGVELPGIARFLQNHPTLTSVELRLQSGSVSKDIVKALSTIPNIREITLFLCASAPLGYLISGSMTLQQLNIFDATPDGFSFKESHALEFVSALEEHHNLRSLWIQPSLPLFAALKTVHVLAGSQRLQSLQLAFGMVDGPKESIPETAYQDFFFAVASTLSVNKTLKTFVSYSDIVPNPKARNEILQMLLRNYSLEQISFLGAGEKVDNEWNQQVDFFLRLNRIGRGRFLTNQDHPGRDWLAIFSNKENDLSSLYYLIRSNPSVCASLLDCMVDESTLLHDSFENLSPPSKLTREQNILL